MSQPVACIPRVPVPPTMSTKPSAPKEKYERDGFWHDVVLAMLPIARRVKFAFKSFARKQLLFAKVFLPNVTFCPEFDKALDWLLIGKSV